jgi:hypothetical protein
MHARAHLPLRLRTGVLFRQLELDRDLADGATPETSPQHAVRARQLASRHKRHELAHQVDCILHRAEHSPHWHSAALPVQTEAVQAARSDLERLRDALLHADMPTLRGLALASVLLHADGSPIFDAGSDTSVTAAARETLSAFGPPAAQGSPGRGPLMRPTAG